MALPAGVTTATVTFGKPLSALGREATITAWVELDRELVWTATGDSFYTWPEPVDPSIGGVIFFTAMHTDQPGFVDRSGAPVASWSYVLRAKIKFPGGKEISVTKPFQIPTGQTTLDLDLVPNGTVTPAVVGPVQYVTSVAGLTGEITEEELADLGIGGPGGGLDDDGIAAVVADGTSATAQAVDDRVVGALGPELAGIAEDVVPTVVTTVLETGSSPGRVALDSSYAHLDNEDRLVIGSTPIPFAKAPLLVAANWDPDDPSVEPNRLYIPISD